jgi:hypothetical protein
MRLWIQHVNITLTLQMMSIVIKNLYGKIKLMIAFKKLKMTLYMKLYFSIKTLRC